MLMKWKAVAALALLLSSPAFASDKLGVTPTEIKVGGVFPFSGPGSSMGLVGTALLAYVKSINDRGGINGRKINYIAYDDAYSPPKSVEQVRKLVEGDQIAFMFSQLGTPGNTASAKYLASRRVPTIGIISGSNKFTDVAEFPGTTTSLVSFVTEGKIYAKFLTRTLPNAKYAILHQNDDLGKDYIAAFKLVLKDKFDSKVTALSYELMDPTVNSQVVSLKNSGAEALLVAGTPKFAAQAVRRAYEIGWKPMIILNIPSASVGSTLKPIGLDRATGIIVGATTKDPSAPQKDHDEGIKNYLAFIDKYLPGIDIADTNYMLGYSQGMLLEQVIKQCGNDLSRENILKQAKSLKNLQLPTVLSGIKVNTSDKVNANYTQMRLQRWTGTHWDHFTEVLDADSE